MSRDPARPAPAIVSRFGDISPAFAAAFGASVGLGVELGARNAEARERANLARRPPASARGHALPGEVATLRPLPPSRVTAAFCPGPSQIDARSPRE